MLRCFACLLTCVVYLAVVAPDRAAADNASNAIRFKLSGTTVEGRAMFWTKANAAVLGDDGRLW